MDQGNKLQRIIKKLTVQQWASIVSTLVAAVFGLVFVAFSGLPSSAWPLYLTYCGFVLTATISILVDRINRHYFENQVIDALEMTGPSDLKYLGESPDGTGWFKDRWHGATEAFNTVFNRVDDATYMKDQLDEYCATVRSALTAGCTWTDIFMPGSEQTVDEFFDSLRDKQKAKYSAVRLPADIPSMQFLLLRYKARQTATLLGWGIKHVPTSAVFCTQEKNITDRYFLAYAKALVAAAKPYIHEGRRIAAIKPELGGPSPPS